MRSLTKYSMLTLAVHLTDAPVSVTLLILVAVVVAAVALDALAKTEHDRFIAVDRVNNSRSEIRLSYAVVHTSGAIAREVWSMQNLNGHSVASYTAVDRKGTKPPSTSRSRVTT